jgi:hypothetical protein
MTDISASLAFVVPGARGVPARRHGLVVNSICASPASSPTTQRARLARPSHSCWNGSHSQRDTHASARVSSLTYLSSNVSCMIVPINRCCKQSPVARPCRPGKGDAARAGRSRAGLVIRFNSGRVARQMSCPFPRPEARIRGSLFHPS